MRILERTLSPFSYPFPTLSLGAVVAVSICTPSGHHSHCVESLAYIVIGAVVVIMR